MRKRLGFVVLALLASVASACGNNPCGTNPAIPVDCVTRCGATPVAMCSSCGAGAFPASRCLADGGTTDGGP